jgi:acetoin:2,6-dichlorophenolindophenol oxidoreductase subunit beta
MRVVEAINSALRTFLQDNPSAYFIGEDVLDPYGGAFKAAKGLSTAFPSQVITTPISEAGIAGLATGLAIKNRPVCVEIMFGDFITLCTDQIINHMSKLPWVYNDQVKAPVVIRTPMGGRRGYGATHSQSLEKHFCGIPGLTVLAISQFSNILDTYRSAFEAETPHLIIENKTIYPREIKKCDFAHTNKPGVVLISYGGCMEHCVAAAKKLHDEKSVAVKIVEITSLWPFEYERVRSEVGNCKFVLSVEEGSSGWGFASEVCRSLIGIEGLHFAELSAPDHPIPCSRKWEDRILPGRETIFAKALGLIKGGSL